MIEELLHEMTLTEKVGQLNQRLYGWELYTKENGYLELTDLFKEEVERFGGIGAIYGIYRSDPWSGKNLETGLTIKEGNQIIKMMNDYIAEHTRLKIPPLISEEVPHGVQGLGTTTLPSNISIGQTWNPKLVEKVQEVAGFESAIRGIHFALISCLDVMRDPRWGRSEECFSEDPYLTKQYAKHSVLGLQKYPVIAVAKHFAAQGSGYAGLNAAPSNIGERELREIHIPPLEGIVGANARMIMAAYNEIDGVLCHDNPWLLRTLAKDEFKYTGGYMADGVALDRLAHLAGSKIQAAARALKAGIDLSLWDDVYPYLEDAIKMGLVSVNLLDEAVLRILEMKRDLGLLGGKNLVQVEEPDYAFVHQLTEESFVLIKNDNNLLPLEKTLKLSVIGPNGDELYNQCGDYTPYKNLTECSTIFKGLREKFDVHYAQGSEITKKIDNGFKQALKVAADSDVIIVAFGGSSARDFNTEFDANGAAVSGSYNMICGENIDVSDLRYPQVQIELIKKLSELGKPMVGLAIQGRPHTLDEVDKYFDALFIGGYPGQHGGRAFAKLLSGESNPSGKLAMSIPKTAFHMPSYYNYKLSHQNPKYIDLNPVSTYGFGYGLSYSNFEISELNISTDIVEAASESIVIRGIISNLGKHDGSEVIQVYLHHEQASTIQRIEQLVGFDKKAVKANTKQSFEIVIDKKQFEVWSQNKQYELESGNSVLRIKTTGFLHEFNVKRIGKQI